MLLREEELNKEQEWSDQARPVVLPTSPTAVGKLLKEGQCPGCEVHLHVSGAHDQKQQ